MNFFILLLSMTPLQAAYAQAQADANAQSEASYQAFIEGQEQAKREALEEMQRCKVSKECMAEMVCHQVEEIEMWKRAIRDELKNPSGVVDLRRLHEYGAAIQQNEYYVREDLSGTRFIVEGLCKRPRNKTRK